MDSVALIHLSTTAPRLRRDVRHIDRRESTVHERLDSRAHQTALNWPNDALAQGSELPTGQAGATQLSWGCLGTLATPLLMPPPQTRHRRRRPCLHHLMR